MIKQYKVKGYTIVATVAAVLFPVATVANIGQTGSALWEGTVQAAQFTDECTFTDATPGTMVLTNNVWTVSSPALVKMKTRGVDTVTVVSDGFIRLNSNAAVVDTVSVSYVGSDVSGGPAAISSVIAPSLFSVMDIKAAGASVFDVSIDGTATLEDTNAMANGESYHVRHIITCIQE